MEKKKQKVLKGPKGRIVAVNGQVAEVAFRESDQPKIHDVLLVPDKEEVLMEVAMSKKPLVFYCLVLRGSNLLTRGMEVVNTQKEMMIPVGQGVLGRAFDVFSDPHDEKGPIDDAENRPLYEPMARSLSHISGSRKIMETGIKALDFFTPLVVGGKAAFVGGAGIGKTVLLTELVNRIVVQKHLENTVAVFSAVGERSREAEELYQNFISTKVLPFTSLILGQMGENPAVRFRTAYAGATIAENFREKNGSNVLYFMDNIYRFAQAGHELSMVMSAIPSEDGYQPTLSSEMSSLLERLISTDKGTISSFMALFVPSDDITDSAVRSILPYMDTMVVLSRDVFQSGRFPAIDLLKSTSAALNPLMIGIDHYNTFIRAKLALEEASGLERIVSLVGESELSPENRLIYSRSQLVISFMAQDLFVSVEETGGTAEFVPMKETAEAVKDILDGKYDQLDPDDLRYIGGIENVEEKMATRKTRALGVPKPQLRQEPAPATP